MIFQRRLVFNLLAALAASWIALGARNGCCAKIKIETVPVGDLGNPNDPDTWNLYGGVNYAYNIGKYEVTVGQYTAFLNAVAATDTYDLYHSPMKFDLSVAGIAQACHAGNCSYSVIGSPNHPVTYVTWGDAARFANWLHNGQPIGAEGPGTTETGAYTLNGAMSDSTLMTVARNANAKWFIASENEWYKAAYYQPSTQGGDSDGYWAYPMKTNSVPYSDQAPGAMPDNTRVGNFYQDDGLANGYDDGYAVSGSTSYSILGSQNYLTDVGTYASSPSYYGTFDQGGNADEWVETSVFSFARAIRGGSWYQKAPILDASLGNNVDPTFAINFVGFRVATIPEPSTAMLAVVTVGLIWLRTKFSC
jgi:formylglycine-generating enzyme